jgi:hypothetical protein
MNNSKPMSKAAMRMYIKSGGCECCPYCKVEMDFDTVEHGELSPVEDGSIEQESKCLKCGRKWMDVFRLAEVHELC